MLDVRNIALGYDPEQQIANMTAIIVRGFPQGTAAICWDCNLVQEFTVEETAKHLSAGTWPRCHDKRMEMIAPEEVPPF